MTIADLNLLDYTFYHTGYVSPVLPETSMFQGVMESICHELGYRMSKGSKRPPRLGLNVITVEYAPADPTTLAEVHGTIAMANAMQGNAYRGGSSLSAAERTLICI